MLKVLVLKKKTSARGNFGLFSFTIGPLNLKNKCPLSGLDTVLGEFLINLEYWIKMELINSFCVKGGSYLFFYK